MMMGLFGMEEVELWVMFVEIGGGFGGKMIVYLELVVFLFFKKLGCFVCIVMLREEVFCGLGFIFGFVVKVKIGVIKSGKIMVG